MSKDLEDGLYKMTHEYEMKMLREAIKKEEEAVALRVTDLKEQYMINSFVFKKKLGKFP